MVSVVGAIGAFLAICIAAIVYLDARAVELAQPVAWGLAAGGVTVACFVIGDTVALQVWTATLGSRGGQIVVVSPIEVLGMKTAIGTGLTVVSIVGYGLLSRRVAPARGVSTTGR